MQDVLWFCLEVSANMFQSFLCVHFLIGSFKGKIRFENIRFAYFIGIISFTGLVTVMNQIISYEGVFGLTYALFFFAFSAVFLYGTLLKKIFISLLLVLCLISTAAVSENFLFAFFKEDLNKIYIGHTFERVAFMVVGLSLLAYVLKFLIKFTNGKKESLKYKEWGLILSVLAISFFAVAEIHTMLLDNKIDKEHVDLLITIEGCIILINILCLYITFDLSETHKREENLLLDKKRSEYSQKYAQIVKEQYDQTRRLRHDMKQYTESLSTLLRTEKYVSALDLIDKQIESLSKVETIIDVDNDFVNAILNTKLTYAKSLNIDVICSIMKNISGIDDLDLCYLLGNMLDNAVSAAEKCDPELRLIEVNIFSVGSRLIILVKNSITSSVLAGNPKLKSSKPNLDNHGFGVKTIRSIADKYLGDVYFYEEDLTFICRVELRNNE